MSPRLRQRTTIWMVATAVPLAVVVALAVVVEADDFIDMRGAIGIGALIAAVAFVLGCLGFVRPAFVRIERAARMAAGLAEGEADTRLGDRLPDEIGDLARNLDRLADERDLDHRSRDQAHEQLAHQSAHDPLTGLPNRQRFRALVESALTDTSNGPLNVVLVDIDDFTLVNELWGQSVGDEVLVAVTSRLRRVLGDSHLLARWAGDEFAILLTAMAHSEVEAMLADVRRVFDEPVKTAVGSQPLRAAVVSAEATPGIDGFAELFNDLETALRSAKEAHARDRQIAPETARLVELALDHDRLEVWFQPVVQLVSPAQTRMVGAEALVRLRDDDETLQVPTDFLGEIMTSAYARKIDDRMAALVLGRVADWQARRLVPDDFLVSLNLSPASLRDPELGRGLVATCHMFSVDPSCIVLDVSEEAGELDPIIAAELRQFGFRLSIDDLGVSRSNFDRLFATGAEFAKLPRRWLGDAVMLDALVMVCRAKGVQVVAEGVETMEQLAVLHAHGVELCQGFVISRPLSLVDFESLIAGGRREPTPSS